jgi:hypothetical protein
MKTLRWCLTNRLWMYCLRLYCSYFCRRADWQSSCAIVLASKVVSREQHKEKPGAAGGARAAAGGADHVAAVNGHKASIDLDLVSISTDSNNNKPHQLAHKALTITDLSPAPMHDSELSGCLPRGARRILHGHHWKGLSKLRSHSVRPIRGGFPSRGALDRRSGCATRRELTRRLDPLELRPPSSGTASTSSARSSSPSTTASWCFRVFGRST